MELNGHYLSRIPKAVPAGKILVHNDIWPPVRHLGTKGFRIGLQPWTASKNAPAEGT